MRIALSIVTKRLKQSCGCCERYVPIEFNRGTNDVTISSQSASAGAAAWSAATGA